jgi:uncharacterized membrane protein (DUF4010 family)
MFSFRAALLLAALIGGVLFISAALGVWLGPKGAIVAAVIASGADIHAATASLGNLHAGGLVDVGLARWTMLALIAASALTKNVIAYSAGGRGFGHRVLAGHGVMMAAAAATVFWDFR